MRTLKMVLIAGVAAAVLGAPAAAEDARFITVASTTSTDNSGLFGAILPAFTARTGIQVRVVAVGTGQAIRLAERGDADVLFVHHPASEQAFVEQGFGVERIPVMHNDFVLLGPEDDPAGVRGAASAADALARIAAARAPFIYRGDDSGTHKKELALWRDAGLDPRDAADGWYRETGSGMGATLNVASGMEAYTLSDRGTWLAFTNRGRLGIVLEGDPPMFNPYGVILVNPAKHPHVKEADGQAFIDWLVSAEGQSQIAAFRIGGEPAFFPDAIPHIAQASR
jgi:tungstate transport system substrate-binding protein